MSAGSENACGPIKENKEKPSSIARGGLFKTSRAYLPVAVVLTGKPRRFSSALTSGSRPRNCR